MSKQVCNYCGAFVNSETNICDNCGAKGSVKQNNKSNETTQKVKVVEKVAVKEVEKPQTKQENREEPKKSWFYRNMEWILPAPIMIALLSPVWVPALIGLGIRGNVEKTFENAGYAVLEYGSIFRDDNISCLVEDADGNEYTMYVSKSKVSGTGYKIVDKETVVRQTISIHFDDDYIWLDWDKMTFRASGNDWGTPGETDEFYIEGDKYVGTFIDEKNGVFEKVE